MARTFVSHRARMSREFDSRKDSLSRKFEEGPRIFEKLRFRELCVSKLSGSHPLDMPILELKIGQKQKVRLWVHETPIFKVIFVTFTEKKWHPGTSEISIPPEITVGTHFHEQHGTKTTLVFLPSDGEASRSLFPSSVSLLSGPRMQSKNTYFFILKVIGLVWESQKRININTNHSYHQRSSL